ncbi:MAG TPA: hypothetical protein VEU32_12860 [Burkholderiales bacterium]|nr:hypothetical protein [Burkholderiales bacterium]
MKRLTALLLLLAGLAAGCASSPRPFNEPLLSVPELLASQDKYQGKIVYVQGFANSGSENHSLCPDPAPESKKDCLPLQIDFGPDEGAKIQWQAADGRPIELKGTFNKSTATLEHVTGAWLEDWK